MTAGAHCSSVVLIAAAPTAGRSCRRVDPGVAAAVGGLLDRTQTGSERFLEGGGGGRPEGRRVLSLACCCARCGGAGGGVGIVEPENGVVGC